MKDQNTRNGQDSVQRVTATDGHRRSILKGAAGTLPMILTLQSGAALARSSNLISAADPDSATDSLGRTLCMEQRSVSSTYGTFGEHSGVYDLGEPAYARICAIRGDRKYWSVQTGSPVVVQPSEMCDQGGPFYTRRRWGYRQVNVPKGMLVSATALSSLAGKVDVYDM